MNAVGGMPAALAVRDTVRLVASGRLKAPVLAALADDDEALGALAALEGVTNGRLRGERHGLPELHPRELIYGRPGHTWINAAFVHTRPGGNRFSDETRGAWYCAFEAPTALAEVAWHLGRELAAVGRYDNTSEYGAFLADFDGPYHDLRSPEARATEVLAPDPGVAYPAGQALARSLRAAGAVQGIVYPSCRATGGTCLVAFHPDSVRRVRQGGLWQLAWRGSPQPEVTQLSAG